MPRGPGTSLRPILAVAASTLLAASGALASERPTDADALARAIEAAMSRPCDPSVLDSSLDFDAIVRRAIPDIEAPGAIKDEFTRGLRRGFDLPEETCRDIDAGGSYTLLRLHSPDGRPGALFRLVTRHGVNYHDLRIDGDRIVDMYIVSNGEWLSEIVRRGFLPLVAQLGEEAPAGVGEAERMYIRHLHDILEMIRLYREGSYPDALDVFHGLPEGLKTHRNVLMQRFAVATRVGGDEYDRAMSDLRAAFPDDPSLGLVLVDYHFNRGEFDEALSIIDRLDARVGGDPYLDFFRANVLLAAGRLDEAERRAREAIQGDPGLVDPYWTLVTISLERKRFDETARLLAEIETGLGIELADLGGIPEYLEFVESDAYTAWMAARGSD